MDAIRQTYFDEAEAKWKRFQLKMQAKGSNSPMICDVSDTKPKKKKRTIQLPPDWTCEGNLLTGERCGAEEAVPNQSRVNYEGTHRTLCTECYAAFQAVKLKNKAVAKKAKTAAVATPPPPEPKKVPDLPPTVAQDDDDDDEPVY